MNETTGIAVVAGDLIQHIKSGKVYRVTATSARWMGYRAVRNGRPFGPSRGALDAERQNFRRVEG